MVEGGGGSRKGRERGEVKEGGIAGQVASENPAHVLRSTVSHWSLVIHRDLPADVNESSRNSGVQNAHDLTTCVTLAMQGCSSN